tara:strand:+ start:126 stop:401 length:276 start_codon:yes stop_codon:yes gene_type:complete
MAEESKLVDKLEDQSKEIKFTDEELASLKQIQQDYLECQTAFGQVAIQKIALQQQIDGLAKSEEEYAKKYSDTQAKEREVAKELNDQIWFR